eukprot:COSAG01_NODE_56371_length_318_cov_128.922374_2_plen_35_part_01
MSITSFALAAVVSTCSHRRYQILEGRAATRAGDPS